MTMYQKSTTALGTVLIVLASSLLASNTVYAVPSFARQTGFECAQCHTVFPQLTPLGRQFKLGGYTMSNATEGEEKPIPIAAGIQISNTAIKKSGMDVASNKFRIPQTASLYYAGKIASNLGAFSQLTYDQESKQTNLAMADIRYATQSTIGEQAVTYGLTLNNMPTLQDAWNSTPAFTFPYEPMAITPMPAAGLGLDMPISMKVVGLGAYGWWNNSVYAELTGYRSRDGGMMGGIQGVAPYWRVAVERQMDNSSFTVGTYGMAGKVKSNSAVAMMMGDSTRYRDIALDAQYQYISDPHIITLYTTLIQRKQNYNMPDPMMMGATMPVNNSSKVFRINSNYVYQRKYGVTLGYFSMTGDIDPNQYMPGEVMGSRTGAPDTKGYIAELDYLPQDKIKLALQYTAYSQFNGASTNYDGFGRNAADNNTVYLLANFMF
jgi:hypothetical protein